MINMFNYELTMIETDKIHLIDNTCYTPKMYDDSPHTKNWYKTGTMLNQEFGNNNRERFLFDLP